eukprot:148775_1
MAQQNNDDTFSSKEHKLKWTQAKKEEYKTDKYNVNNTNDWRNIPLFSNALDPNNPQAAAIMSLQKREKPKSRAKHYKSSGNKAYLLGPHRYQDAITYYTQALDVKCKDNTLNSTIYANRAQIQLCLKNYGKVISDCVRSIELQPNTYKSYWRAAMASRALSKHTEAIQFCDNGLCIMQKLIENETRNPTPIDRKDADTSGDSSSESEEDDDAKTKKTKKIKTELQKLNEQYLKLKQLKVQCVAQKMEIEHKLELKQQKQMELQRKKEKERNAVKDKLMARGIVVGKEDKYNLSETYGKYKIKYDAKMDKLQFPVMFIYPQHNQSDFIKCFGENQHFVDHLNQMFKPLAYAGPSWDKEDEYLSHRLCVFYETKDRFVNVNVNKSLKDIVERKDYVIPMIPVFFVLSKDAPFTSEFIKRKSEDLLN